MQTDNQINASPINENLSKIKHLKFKSAIAQIIYTKSMPGKSNKFWYLGLVYNICIWLISLMGFVPIIMHIINPGYETVDALGIFFGFVLFFSVIYLIDFVLRMITIEIYYEVDTYKKALKKQIFSIYTNYQLISSLVMILLIAIDANNYEGYISFKNSSLGNDNAMLLFSVLFLLNIPGIFPRIIIHKINYDNYKACKRIIFTKRYTFLFALLIMFGVWLLFSYILFILEKNGPATDTGNPIKTIGEAMYFTFTTMTTLGLGDYVPCTAGGRVMTVIIAIFGVIFYGYVGSIFVNIYIEFVNKKKQMRTEVINQKVKESENKKLLKDINDIVLKNLHLSGVINEKKYKELLEKTSDDEINKIIYTMNDFTFEEEKKKIFLNNVELGKKLFDHKTSHDALQHNWLALMNKPWSTANIHAVLARFPSSFIEQLKDNEQMPIIFTSKFVDENVQKIIAFRKQTLKSAVLEINVFSSMTFEKENAWNLFGGYTKMSKNKFDSTFRRVENVNVLFVKDIIIYDHYKPLEAFGINTNGKVEDIYYLK